LIHTPVLYLFKEHTVFVLMCMSLLKSTVNTAEEIEKKILFGIFLSEILV